MPPGGSRAIAENTPGYIDRLQQRAARRHAQRDHNATERIPPCHSGGRVRRIRGETLSLQHDVAGNFPAWPERLLRLAIQLRLDPAGIAKRQHELILPFPLGFFAGAQ